jgi:CubicO group peptidase (beta-lactamase class C family)
MRLKEHNRQITVCCTVIVFLSILFSATILWSVETRHHVSISETLHAPNESREYPLEKPVSFWKNATDLDRFISWRLWTGHIPGFAAAIVKDGRVAWHKNYGYSRVYSRNPVTDDTLFQLASISKTVIAVALMQIWEKGDIDLDIDINTYLPFQVKSPHFSNTPITTRMLLTHTSAIIDNWNVLSNYYVWNKDSPVTLEKFLEGYLTSYGKDFNADLNFGSSQPGKAYQYSNVGATLAAYLVEVVSGMAFDTYCEKNIFEPLGMDNTYWRLADMNLANVAMPYGFNSIFRLYYPFGFYAYPDYPDGRLTTSTLQLARFLIMFIQGGTYNGTQILAEETVQEIKRVQYPEIDAQQGLLWYYKELDGMTLLGHNGGEYGVATEMFFRPEDGTGVILLMNGDWSTINYSLIMAIEKELFGVADSL